MNNYKLTEEEARTLATEISKSFNKVSIGNPDFDKWAKDYMLTFNKVMNSLEQYKD